MNSSMNLVLFMDALEHIVKIVRVIETPLGHSMLVGVGGSGRKSLATLSSFIAFQSEPMQVDSKIWIEEIQKVVKTAGLEEKQTVFIFSDTQISQEFQLEHICNLLNNGEIPNLFPLEERMKIIEEIGTDFQGSANQKFNHFIQQCKQNLHLVLAFSPVGEPFRKRLRVFPSLVNCTTIDWFLPWPENALRDTAENHFVKNMELTDENDIKGLVEISVDMQIKVNQLSKRYYEELRRYYYVTPTSFLSLLSTFQNQFKNQRQTNEESVKRYEVGTKMIIQTETTIEQMQIELNDLQPLLEQKTIDNALLLQQLKVQQKEADQKRELCEADEAICTEKKDQADKLREECQFELDKVIPLLNEAQKSLDSITNDDMNFLKSYIAPPASAEIVMEGMCYALDEDRNVKFTPIPGKFEKIQDFWDYSKKKLLNNKLIGRIKAMREAQIRGIPNKNIEKLKQFCQNPLFEKEKVFNASKAAGNLALWIRAIINTYGALLVVDPKRKIVAGAEEELNKVEGELNEKKANLETILNLLNKLENDYNSAKDEKEQLEEKVNKCKVQLERADKLIKGLSGEKISWVQKAKDFKESLKSLLGDTIISSGVISYLGPFPINYREEMIQRWIGILNQQKIRVDQNIQIQKLLCDAIKIGEWTNKYSLPNDNFSIDNAIILKNSHRWPLMIDPQNQANIWIKKMEKESGLKVLKPNSTINDVMLVLETAITAGFPVLLENIGEEIDQHYESVLQKKIHKGKLKFGEKDLAYDYNFKFFITTKLSRPHYSPEVCVKVNMLNFQVTQKGLEDQMLNIIVKIEEPKKEQQRQTNIIEYFENKAKQNGTEDIILKLLNDAKGDLLNDEELIETLQKSQSEGKEIFEKLKKQENDQVIFKQIRDFYKDAALRVSTQYFVINDLNQIEPTYQWSLEFYINICIRAIEKAIPGKDQRVKNIINKFQFLLYQSICRSLLEKDKLIFSFMMCIKIMETNQSINQQEIRHLMVGPQSTEATSPKPDIQWITEKMWVLVCELAQTYEGFDEDFVFNNEKWRQIIYDDKDQAMPLDIQLNEFQKLLIVRFLYPDKFNVSVQQLLITEMGEEYVSPPAFNLLESYQDSTQITPLIFILSSGADPRLEIQHLAETQGKEKEFRQISLGQGQGELAEHSIKQGMEDGLWILLQNCHLAPSFMPDLDRILENQSVDCNPNFRIWLTSMPSNVFPSNILMKGIKMTYEPPRGLKSNLMRQFQTQTPKQFEDCLKPQQWKKMFFGLSFFHALITERKTFGPLGWNIPYEFTIADFTISQSQLKMFLDEFPEIPYTALNYMVAEANYGGRVTDPMDRRLIKIILKDFYTPDILDDNYKFSESGTYYAPQEGPLQYYTEFIKENFPRNQTTEIFGLHSNAQITSSILETNKICSTILNVLPRQSNKEGVSQETLIKQKIEGIVKKIPQLFDLKQVQIDHKIDYKQSLNTVLQQELIRFNKLVEKIITSLKHLNLAIDGLMVMSIELEQIYYKIMDNQVPDEWMKVSYPSLKPLGSYIIDLLKKLNFMQNWVQNGIPKNFWLPGFYFTQSFLTGIKQNFARRYVMPIDTIQFNFEMIQTEDAREPPQDGCYIYGIYLDGAKFNLEEQTVDEQDPKELYSELPYIWLIPTDEPRPESDFESIVYECPLYKTSRRAGTLSTTGHSTNFVMQLQLPLIGKNSAYWIKRGVAALCSLND